MLGFNPKDALSAVRPPTPPKESYTKLPDTIDSGLLPNLVNGILLDTPDESPSSSAEYFKCTAEKAQKKVGFSPWTEFHRLPLDGSKESDSDGSIRRLPPSRDCKSVKSILKACKDETIHSLQSEAMALDQGSLPVMLRSSAQRLAGNSRDSRLDAYVNLLRCLSAYDDVPDTADLPERIMEILGHIRRDVSRKMESDESLDTQMLTQALKIVTGFISIPTTARLLPEDFCSFILEQSILSIEDVRSPKIIVTHYMHLLEKQKFHSRNMTAERVNRLISSLSVVTDRIKGNRIVCHRLVIYQRLLTQAKSVLAARISAWIDQLISGMLSSIKEIRVRAIGFGFDAALQLGTSSSVSKSCIEVFKRVPPHGKTVIDFLSSRLVEMAGSKEEGIHVPQIWSIVILFFRSRRRQLEDWEHIKPWLAIIQRCLNSSDPQVKFHANIAWSRLIFTINPDNSTSSSMTKLLRQPMMFQFDRKSNDKASRQSKQVSRSTYCTLLYYAFRPGSTTTQLDQYWELYIAQVLPVSFTASKSDINYACEVFAALLSPDGHPKIWNENRGNMIGPVKPDELPCIDPKWIRSQTANIMQIFYKLFDLADWQGEQEQEAPVWLAWRSFMAAIGAASSKEIKVSMATMHAVSCISNFMRRIMERDDPFEKIKRLLREAVARIGNIPFLEPRLVLTNQNSFEPAETPSSRSMKNSSSLNSPAIHILGLLLMHTHMGQSSAAYKDTINFVINMSLQTAATRREQLGALRKIALLLSADKDRDINESASSILWDILVECTCSSLRLNCSSDLHNPSLRYPGQDYRVAVKMLETGIQLQSNQIITPWLKLYACIASSLRDEVGDDGVALLLTQPLIDSMRNVNSICTEVLLMASTALLNDFSWPKSHQDTERAEKMLWGPSHVSKKPKSDNLLHGAFAFIDSLLRLTHGSLSAFPTDMVHAFLTSVTSMVKSCPSKYQAPMLQGIQNGVAFWIEDDTAQMKSLDTCVEMVNELWMGICAIIEKLPTVDAKLLQDLQQILLLGLRSKHKSILSKTIETWNCTFGSLESLEYPEELRKALLKLRSVVVIHLPSLAEAEMDEAVSPPIHFQESQIEEAEVQPLPPAKFPVQLPRATKSQKASKVNPFDVSSRFTNEQPLKSRREPKTTPKARLRHDDSQVQFAAVESSSPTHDPAESQNLTTRQKEVKERQGHEAAMFPEIGSSPRSPSRRFEYNLPRLIYTSGQHPAVEKVVEDQISPVYPPDTLMNDFLGSSPTPASTKKSSKGTKLNDDLPSSPPLPFVHEDRQDVNVQAAVQKAQLPVITSGDKSVDGMNLDRAGLPADTVADNGGSDVQETPRSIAAPKRSPHAATAACETTAQTMSDSDSFVDAPSEPVGETTVDVTNAVSSPVGRRGSSDYLSESDQINAQLVGEMERASSQSASQQSSIAKNPSRSAVKRRGIYRDDAATGKKARTTPVSANMEGVSATPQAREFIAECVLINVRQLPDRTPISPTQIKKERSQSPPFVSNPGIEDETQNPKPQQIRRSVKTRDSQQCYEGSSLSGNPWNKRKRPGPSIDEGSVASDTQPRARKSARLSGTSTSSWPFSPRSSIEDPIAEPGSVTKSGRRRASKRWFWRKEASDDDENEAGNGTNAGISSANDDSREVPAKDDRMSKEQESEHSEQVPGEQEGAGAQGRDQECQAGSSRQRDKATQTEGVDGEMSNAGLSSDGILQGFRKIFNNLRRMTLGREEEREMVGVLFESVKEVHEAGRRHSAL